MPELEIDIRPILRAIEIVNRNVDIVRDQVELVESQVEIVAREQADTREALDRLYAEFLEYVEKDQWATVVSTARQELTLIRQQLEKDFGHYDAVRAHTTGILQAVDVGVVRKETIHTATENLMMSCPRYWLAPALISLSAWISDDRSMAEKALAEAIRRNDSKTSLFYSLVCQRSRRMEACGRWLVRYFQNQDPTKMSRAVVVMLDALANGLFGGAALTACSEVVDEWLAVLEEQAGFPDEQRKRWAEALDLMTPKLEDREYPTLRKYSPTWAGLEAGLASARRNQVILSFFEDLFTGEIVVPSSLATAVDDILDSLVRNYDDEELPLRRNERYPQIVIEVDQLPGRASGKKVEVDRRFQTESEALEEETSFAALLTNSAMYPERYGATKATQRYAVSQSQSWIISGFNDLTARDRARVPTVVELRCGSWKGTSTDGSNEPELSADLQRHYADRIEAAVNAVGIERNTWVITAIGGIVGLFVLVNQPAVGLLILLGTVAFFFIKYRDLENVRQRTREALEKERHEALRILKAALAELADLRRESGKEDRKANDVVALLSALNSPQFILGRPEQTRRIMA